MKALFGVVSLLIVLAVVGLLASRGLKTGPAALSTGMPASGATVKEQSQQAQQKLRDDMTRALEQGAARREEADK